MHAYIHTYATHTRTQIQKFVSIVDHLISEAGLHVGGPNRDANKPLRIIDMGCGKGYLTFATHVHLAQKSAGDVNKDAGNIGAIMGSVLTEGVEMRPDLVEKTNEVAKELGLAPGTGQKGPGQKKADAVVESAAKQGEGGLRFVQGYIAEHADRIEVCMCIYIYIYIYIYVCMYACMYVCMDAHTRTHTHLYLPMENASKGRPLDWCRAASLRI
jgi:hypothetical protein